MFVTRFTKTAVSMLAVTLFSALLVGGCAVQTTIGGRGAVSNAVLAVKDYETVGLVFVRSETSEVTYEALLQEAQKLGADDIINLRRDIVHERSGTGIVSSVKIIYTATALAIKYKDAVGIPAGEILMLD